MDRSFSKKSTILVRDTECPGLYAPIETQQIIRERYELASELVSNKRVLEVGPGCGWGLDYLSEFCSSIVGLEFCQENISAIINRLSSDVSIFPGDAHNMPFSEESFDIIIAMAMIYYLDLNLFLREACRVLTPDGLLFFCTSNKDVPGFCPAPGTNSYYSLPDLHKYLNNNGYVSSYYGSFPSKGNALIRLVSSSIKNIVKYICQLTPIGKWLWKQFRTRYLGQHDVLPSRIVDMLASPYELKVLDPSFIDNTHRVIYIFARKTTA